MTPIRIPDSEFAARIARTADLVGEAGLDVLIVHSNEADFANVRYLSDYWPLFESAGVLVTREGESRLLIGPESETFAGSRSKIAEIRKLIEYREPAEPNYPSIAVHSFRSVVREALGDDPKRIGIAGWAILPLPVFFGLQQAFPQAELVKADEILFQQRQIKSAAELACQKEAYRITRLATEKVMAAMRPGMSELELVGIAQACIYASGAEYEGLPQYILSGVASAHAIGRAGYRRIEKGDIVQLNLSARIHGYSASIGVPVSVGPPSASVRQLLEFGLEAHNFTRTLMKAGAIAGSVAREYEAFVKAAGFAQYMLYGPCHGTGMIEVEHPWIESDGTYALEPGMTFQIDTFFYTPEKSPLASDGRMFGLRWENGCHIRSDGCELLSEGLTKLAIV